MGIKKTMTGTPWHIEKIPGEANHNKRNCFNCKYLDGHWCREKLIQVTNNNAPICDSFKNKYQTKPVKIVKKKTNNVKSKAEKNIKNDSHVKKMNEHIPTILQIKTSKDTLTKMKEKINQYGEYHFRGIVEDVFKLRDIFPEDVDLIYIDDGITNERCDIKWDSFEIIESGRFMTVAFIIKDFDAQSFYKKKKYYSVCKGRDCFYGQVFFLQNKKTKPVSRLIFE